MKQLAILTLLTVFLAACGGGTSTRETAVETTPLPADSTDPADPVVQLSADADTVSSGDSIRLSWSAENASFCTASGDWSGTKATSGEELISGLVTNMATVSLTSPADYVWSTLANGAEVYIDRTYTYTSIPPAYEGLEVLKTANDDKSSTTGSFITFDIDKSITLYVAHVDAGTNLPAWLSAWTATGETISTTDRTLFIYKKEFDAGTVVLGGNNGSPSMYTVFIASSETAGKGSPAVFNLSCEGGGTSVMASVSVTVVAPSTPPPGSGADPVVQISSDFDMVGAGGSVRLSWSAKNATACTASGAWSGDKAISGSEDVSIDSDSTFTLSCEGNGKTIVKSVLVAVVSSSSVVSGSVDSSFISRPVDNANAVYVYSGTVSPDDRDGDAGDPLMVVPVVAVENSCGWKYSVSSLGAGDYTFAFTDEANIDNPATDDTLNFVKVLTLNVSGTGQVLNFDANNIIRVGPSRVYKTPSEAYAVASSGDVIEIDAGVYADDIVVWRQNNLTLRGTGGRAHIQATRQIEYVPGTDSKNGMGIWVTRGRNIKIENMEFSGASVPDENGAGIRMDGRDLTICNSYFHENENGVLGAEAGFLLIEYSEFANNGLGDGYTHNMYIGSNADKFILKNSYTHHAKIGHNVKTRAKENYILYNRIMDEDSGTSSYSIDVPNGGATYIIGNLVQQGANTGNSTMISYGAEGLRSGRNHQLYIVNNTLVNDRSNGTFVYVSSGTISALLTNNILLGNGRTVSGAADMASNYISTDASVLVNRSTFDYRITNDSNVVDAATDPGSANGISLMPSYQYVYDSMTEVRNLRGAALDIGAFEFSN